MQFKSCGGVNPIEIALVPAAVPESESFGIIWSTTLSEESWFAPFIVFFLNQAIKSVHKKMHGNSKMVISQT